MAYNNGDGSIRGPINFNTTGSANTVINSNGNGLITMGNSASGLVTIDNGSAGLNIGTTANAHSTFIGSTTGAAGTNMVIGSNNFALTSPTGNIMTATAAGVINKPLQPSFFITQSSNIAGVLGGSGTVLYNIKFDTVVYDTTSSYSTSTGVYTIPQSGNWWFWFAISFYGITSATYWQTGAMTYTFERFNPYRRANAAGECMTTGEIFRHYSAGDTISIASLTQGSSGGKTIGIKGSTTQNIFAGRLLS